jgi:hypothetical protein
MAFIAIGSGLATALGASATTAGLVGAAAGVGGSLIKANQAKKAASGLAAAQQQGAIDINKLISDARTNAAENYKTSIALEQQYNPAQAALRGSTNLALANLADENTAGARARNSLLTGLTGAPNSLLQHSADSILEQLALGGSLSPETQNAVMRGSLQRAGQSGIAGSQAGRGLVARDLGLTSLQLQQQRQAAALQAGQVLSSDFLGRLGAAQNASNSDAQRTGLLAAAIQGSFAGRDRQRLHRPEEHGRSERYRSRRHHRAKQDRPDQRPAGLRVDRSPSLFRSRQE